MGQFWVLTLGLCTPPSGGGESQKIEGAWSPLNRCTQENFEMSFVVGFELPDTHGDRTVQRHVAGSGCGGGDRIESDTGEQQGGRCG